MAASFFPYRTRWHDAYVLQDDMLLCVEQQLQCHLHMRAVSPVLYLERRRKRNIIHLFRENFVNLYQHCETMNRRRQTFLFKAIFPAVVHETCLALKYTSCG